MTSTLIFDCDGVLADTERDGHLPAFNATFEAFGVPVRWSDEEYGELLAIGGGKERLATIFQPGFAAAAALPADPAAQRELIAQWHRDKTRRYTEAVAAGAMPGRPGIARLVHEAAEAGWTLAVASTSAEASVRAVLEHAVGPDLASRFAVFAGDIVPRKKPAPDIYDLAVAETGADPARTIVVEDSSVGLRAARAAGLTTVVTVSSYTREERFEDAALVVDSLGDLPDTPATVLADPTGARIDGQVTLADLERLMSSAPLSNEGDRS